MLNSVAKYRRCLKKNLRCSSHTRKKLLHKFDLTLADYLSETTMPDMNALIKAFGPAEEMARILMSEVSTQDLSLYRLTKQLTRITVLALTLIWMFFTIYVYFQKEIPVIITDEGYYNPASASSSLEEMP